MNLARDKSSLELSWNPCLRSGSRMRSEAWGEVGFRFVGTRAASQGVGVGNKTADTSQAFTVGPGSVQFSCSVESDSSTPWTAARQASLSSTISWSLLKFMSIDSGDAIQPSHPLLLPSPPSLNSSQHQALFQSISGDRITFGKNVCSSEEKLRPT